MKTRPRELMLLSIAFAGVALSFPLQVILAYGHTPWELQAILERLAPLNWVVIFLAALHATLIYHASAWAYLSTPFFLAAVTWNNWVVAETGVNASPAVAHLSTIVAFCVHFPLFGTRAISVLTDPKMRWWRTPPRLRTAVDAVIRPVLGGEATLKTYDLSTGGAFISLEGRNWIESLVIPRTNLKVGSRITIRLKLDQIRVIQCNAEIVRHTGGVGNYPSGFGLRFVCMDNAQRKTIQDFIDACIDPKTVVLAPSGGVKVPA